jgi:TonB family protein
VPEREVTERARLVSSGPLRYPEAARRAELEADVALELVVGPDGRVASARVVRPAGYGLDDEAVRAVRAYRFSPARLDGRPVRVRMPWTVQFRLR